MLGCKRALLKGKATRSEFNYCVMYLPSYFTVWSKNILQVYGVNSNEDELEPVGCICGWNSRNNFVGCGHGVDMVEDAKS